jgi:predicted NodU family carbamoyl transferase
MLTLGLSSLNHDTAAALFEDGTIKAAIEEDKLTRSRSTGLPGNAIRFCLESAGATWQDIDNIAVATRPFCGWRRRSLFHYRQFRVIEDCDENSSSLSGSSESLFGMTCFEAGAGEQKQVKPLPAVVT